MTFVQAKASIETLKSERLEQYEQRKAKGEKKYYDELERVTQNNALALQEAKALREYRANLDYYKAEIEVKRQDDNRKRDTMNLLTRQTNKYRMANARNAWQE